MCGHLTVKLLERVCRAYSGQGFGELSMPTNPNCIEGDGGWEGTASILHSMPALSCHHGPDHSCFNSRLGEPFPLSPVATSQALAGLSGLLPFTADCLVEFTEEPSLSSPSDTLPECSPTQAALYITQISWVINVGPLEFWDCLPGPLQQSFL